MQTTPVAVRAMAPPSPLPPLPPEPPLASRESDWPGAVHAAKWTVGIALFIVASVMAVAALAHVLEDKCNCGNTGCTVSKHRAMQRH
jgi:hypothetical protein